MLLIDTNIISELWKPNPNQNVVAWLDAQAMDTIYLSVITIAELQFGIEIMPTGQRKSIFQRRLNAEVFPAFAGRIKEIDIDVAQSYADLMVLARKKGQGIGIANGYIAATAAVHHLTVITRDISPFETVGVNYINPFN